MFKNTPKTFYMGGATPTDRTMINRGVFFMGGADTSTQDWTGKPSDWSDIRKDCPANSIALYAGHTADYSQYDNLGFTATCVGGYNVFIDGTQYGSTYASGAQCNITWSSLALDTGDDITTPSALKAHKIWISPATSGNNITAFRCARTAGSGNEHQGVLWGHLNISNSIDLSKGFNYTEYYNDEMEALTCKGNKLTLLGCDYCFYGAESLEYIPQKIDYSSVSDMTNYITNASGLGKTNIDATSSTLTKIGTYGDSSHFISGIKSLRVSSSAPFNNATSPQINVSYTGVDRDALVQLFNDLPTVSAGQIINITGTVGANNLTGADMDIAINKGWTITGSRDYVIDNGVLTWANPNLYLQSTGAQYIDTGLKGITNFQLDTQGAEATNTSQVVISRNSPDGNFFGQFSNTQKWGMNGSTISADYTTRCKFDLVFDDTGCGYTYEGVSYRVNGTAALTNNFYLYRSNSAGPYWAKCKIFSCKAYQDSVLVQHLVPVPQGLVIGNFTCPDNGMFDIISQQFYANAGTGAFTYGKDI